MRPPGWSVEILGLPIAAQGLTRVFEGVDPGADRKTSESGEGAKPFDRRGKEKVCAGVHPSVVRRTAHGGGVR